MHIYSDAIRIIKDGILYQLTPAEEGGYTVTVSDYSTCITQGETIDEALAYAEDALLGCLLVDEEAGLPLSPVFAAWLSQARETLGREAQDPTTHRTYPST